MPKPGHEPDEALVRRATTGEGAAFNILVSRHRPALLRLCRRVAGDPMLAEDCAQDASLLALLRLHRLREPDQFGAWLRGIGLRVSRRAVQRAVARPFEAPVLDVEQAGSEFTGEADGSSWEDALTAAELSKQLRRAVDDLPHGQREAVRLFYLGGRTYQ
ncbi:MAG TPA: sigma-70 family RNA polymerase sigma factor, partial [Chloroflexota bacterium]|nr:sigma-70 family RNA polymerase sigma factor [Chloroflexota bacterium]